MIMSATLDHRGLIVLLARKRFFESEEKELRKALYSMMDKVGKVDKEIMEGF